MFEKEYTFYIRDVSFTSKKKNVAQVSVKDGKKYKRKKNCSIDVMEFSQSSIKVGFLEWNLNRVTEYCAMKVLQRKLEIFSLEKSSGLDPSGSP